MGTVDVQSSLEMQVLLLSAWLGSALCLPQAAHVSPQAPGLSAHPNPAHTFLAGFQQGAHPNAAHTALRPDCARFQGASPVLLGMKSALWTTRPPAAPAGESEVPTVMVLTLRQELPPTSSPTTPLSSPTRLILSQQPFQ